MGRLAAKYYPSMSYVQGGAKCAEMLSCLKSFDDDDRLDKLPLQPSCKTDQSPVIFLVPRRSPALGRASLVSAPSMLTQKQDQND